LKKVNSSSQVKQTVKNNGYCVIVASEGTQMKNGKFLADSGLTDAFGHKQLGGVAPVLASMISKIGFKNHWAVADYLQRSARHICFQNRLRSGLRGWKACSRTCSIWKNFCYAYYQKDK